MQPENLQSFLEIAERQITLIRSSLLVVAQAGGRTSDLAVAARGLRQLKDETEKFALDDVTAAIVECERAMDRLFMLNGDRAKESYSVLDLVAKIEAELLEIPLLSSGLDNELADFLEVSFQTLSGGPEPEPKPAAEPEPEPETNVSTAAWLAEEFDVDEETLDIFRGEAAELLERIETDLGRLKNSPGDKNALWDIRRSAHTFKGAAGIVGLKKASQIAHKMEDLLDKLVELQRPASSETLSLLDQAAGDLASVVGTRSTGEQVEDLDARFAAAIAALSVEETPAAPSQASPERQVQDRRAHTPIVRVSLDRLDDLIKLATKLADNNSLLERAIAEHAENPAAFDADTASGFLFAAHELTASLVDNLRQVRMQRFGTLETRLNRAVHVTCEEEGKQAMLTIENGDVEIDTLLIDALVEPLLHLLRNSVVHGIEPVDRRRLLGKPEKGSITVKLRADDGLVMLSVEDDGRGIAAETLKEKAVASGQLPYQEALNLSDQDALQLIFSKGLTTAERINLNAGRGVGMSIVKESIEHLGGTVQVMSDPQKGTRFVLTIPIAGAALTRVAATIVPATNSTGEPPLILVVDDSASIRRHNTKLIEKAGYRAISAVDGVEALEVLLSGNWQPDLIMSDVEMPRMDGWELLSTLSGSDELSRIPVAMVTSLDADADRQKAETLGASYYFVKPLKDENLTQLISSLN